MPFVRFRSAVRLGRAIQRAPQIQLRAPLHIVRDEQVQLAVAIVIEPRRAGAEARVLNARALGHIAKFSVALVVKKMIAIERGDVHVFAAVVIVIGNGDAHSVHFDIQAAAARNIGERAVVVVVIERRQGFPAAGRPVLAVDQQNVRPAVAIGIEERATRAQRLRQDTSFPPVRCYA